jgi:hypothetical protein
MEMEQIMEMLAKMQEKADANKEKADANRKADREEMLA